MDEINCMHCGQSVNSDGVDARGSINCDEFAADEDMQDELHDWDMGPVEPCCYGYITSGGMVHEVDCFSVTGVHRTTFPSYE